MFPITLDTALNLVWAAISVAALALLARLEWRNRMISNHSKRLQRLVAVLLVTVALFPCVSFSDDLFSFSFFQTHNGKHGGWGTPLPEDAKEKASLHLLRVLLSLDHSQITVAYVFAVTVCFFATVLFSRKLVTMRDLVLRTGRAPPLSPVAN